MVKRMGLVIFFLLLLSFLLKIYHDTQFFKMNRVTVQSDKIHSGSEIRIVQISDLHDKVFGKNNKSFITAVEKTHADAIVLTGDLINTNTRSFTPVFSLIERISTKNKNIYFVSGNHDWTNPKYNLLLKGLQERGVRLLNNTQTQIVANGVPVNLVGVDDPSTDHEDLDKAFRNVDKSQYTILLAHDPAVTEEYPNIPAELILSGHTHGGQIRLPLIGALIAPSQGFFPRLDKGLFKLHPNQFLYVDSGLGTSVLPVRLFNQSQFSLITIRGK
ncbi:metallophosphoesterase [Sporolactobacillus sp. THM19-2]|uniref:metallophosphoesterase n=1 Tax=Sporolactobacillus sp. THM19-2 TaxID=2511171 RepID=UPI001F114B98|nr:metallophosphoesterase [Sporolactobacillus sp. THM19-2]